MDVGNIKYEMLIRYSIVVYVYGLQGRGLASNIYLGFQSTDDIESHGNGKEYFGN